MANFHYSGSICQASVRPCPYGLEDGEHIEAESIAEFETKLAAKMETAESAFPTTSAVKAEFASYPKVAVSSVATETGGRKYAPETAINVAKAYGVDPQEVQVDENVTVVKGDRRIVLDQGGNAFEVAQRYPDVAISEARGVAIGELADGYGVKPSAVRLNESANGATEGFRIERKSEYVHLDSAGKIKKIESRLGV